MKLFFNLFGMVLAGVLGYVTEPQLRFQLTGIQPSATEIAAHGKVILKMPDGSGDIDLEKLTADQLPQRILVKSAVKVLDTATGMAMTIDAGNRVKLVKIDGANAVVSPGDGPYLGKIPLAETDIFEQLGIKATPTTPPPTVPETPPDATNPPVEPPPVVEPTIPPVIPEPPPTPEPKPEEPVAVPEPKPEPPPAEPSRPEIEPIPAAGGDVVKVMHDSIKGGQIKEFTFEQVLEWKATDDETVDGESYKTGTATYKAETIFGMKQLQAKALIKGGKVQRWIRPKSGLEIK